MRARLSLLRGRRVVGTWWVIKSEVLDVFIMSLEHFPKLSCHAAAQINIIFTFNGK